MLADKLQLILVFDLLSHFLMSSTYYCASALGIGFP